jgi:multiple sugar transport system substrate-binding protein
MWESELYNSPAFFNTKVLAGDRGYPALKNASVLRDVHNAWFNADPYALEGEKKDKLVVLRDAEKWSTNVGHPGPANPAEGEIFSTFIIPNMFARVAQGKQGAEDSVKQAAEECRKVFAKWRAQGLVGKKG